MSSACAVLPVPLYHIFPHYLITAGFSGKKKVIEQKAGFDFLYNLCLQYFSLYEFSETLF
jgi:hypothetical protein